MSEFAEYKDRVIETWRQMLLQQLAARRRVKELEAENADLKLKLHDANNELHALRITRGLNSTK